ncbi:hypothetical protein GIB67_035945 [Kingdonia uniflora]|uniref:Uncharacterized protein n=1 Tax=Kingdonia uniflora TaxID=39325 RepID=A0A7J7N122_9MAGN|nr:hypothetical protein GIB67_035945 [Kingdonia uniflora]
MGGEVDVVSTKSKEKGSSLFSIFMHADTTDMILMTLGFLGSIGDGSGFPLLMFLTSKIMNSVGGGFTSDPHTFSHNINKNVMNILYLAAGTLIACFLEGYCWSRTGERQASRMRASYLRAVLRQDVSYFDLQVSSVSEVVTRVSNDSLVIQDVISEKVPNFLTNLTIFLMAYIVAFVLLWRMALVGLPFVLLLIIPGLIYSRILMVLVRKIMCEYDKAGNIVEQAISSIRTVYSFVGESKTMNGFSVALEGCLKYGLKQGLVKGVAIGSNGITFAVWALMAWYASRLVMYHDAKGGTVFAVGTVMNHGGIAFGSGLLNVKYFAEAFSAGERIMEVIKRVPKIDSDNMEGGILQSVSGDVEFKNVKFAYPSRPENTIFEAFCLKLPAGKTVALVGRSGSGKSTIIALLQRFYDPLEGEIFLDGITINKLQLKWLRSQMGLVSQEPCLFATSIKENILFGKEDATMDEVIDAAKVSNAHNFISQLPQGYYTQVGERGVQMSGGQKQRIALARAIIKAPRILLLDEATSALDSESEIVVQEALEKAAVDVIAVVQTGQVIETGTHDELIYGGTGLYASLFRLQQLDKKTENEECNMPGSSSHITNRDSIGSSRRLSLVSQTSSANSVSEVQVVQIPSFRRLLLLNLPEWKQAILGCSSAVLCGTVQPVYMYIMGSMISVYFLTNHEEIKSKVQTYSLFFLALAVFSFTINIIQHYNFGAMGEHLTKRIRERMLAKIMTFEVGWFDQDENSSGAIFSRLTKDASAVRSLVGDRISLLVQVFSATLVAWTMGLIITWKFALVMIAEQPLIVIGFYLRRILLKRMSSKAIKCQDQCSKVASEAVSNHRTVTAFSSQARILKILDRAQDGPRKESIRQSWYAGLGLGVSQFFMFSVSSLSFWYGGKLLSQGDITSKALFQTFLIIISTGRVIADAASMTTDIAKGSDAVESVFTVLDRVTKIDPQEGNQTEKKLVGQVEFCNVHFAYPARPDIIIFRDFSLTIESNKSTALVGQSGSGKSTIIGLIERFYDPSKGSVKIDRRDIRSYHLRSLRKHIALVSQEPTLFDGTIRENIAYGSAGETVDEYEIVNAARAANAHDFIAGLNDGYDTPCGDRGIQLSGGQKQRIAIARAILKNPSILLLDEATSALDSQSEKLVQEALDHVMNGRTSVVIAHRLSSIQNCDLIAVLEKGVIVEKGTHSSLMGKGSTGAYFSLINTQQRLTTNLNVD